MLSCLSLTVGDVVPSWVSLLARLLAGAEVLLHEMVALLDLTLQTDRIDLEESNLLTQISFDL